MGSYQLQMVIKNQTGVLGLIRVKWSESLEKL